MNYCICVSGGLGLTVLQHLVDAAININCVFTDHHSDGIIAYCNQHSLPTFVGNPRNGKAKQWMEASQIEFDNLLSINYLFILETDVLDCATNYAINFHGSLLPKYRGRTPHVWAIINGETECGITAHLMNSHCDDGDIVKQLHVPIEYEDTGAIILNKYNLLYPSLVKEIVDAIESGNIDTIPQDISKATYYGKRTPENGGINWDWQKERIRNWVRAQAKPYPGAFTHINESKVTIHKIEYIDYGYSDSIVNGTVLTILDEKPIVKTQNGTIILTDFECSEIIKEGNIFKTINV